jgi:cardiolipin synthase
MTLWQPSLPRARGFVGFTLLTLLAGCSHVLPPMQITSSQAGRPAFSSAMVAYTGASVVGGNRVEILLNGDEIFPAKLRAIRGARKTINYAQYVFEEGEASAHVAAALAERCRAGVKVNVLLDGVGSLLMPGEYVAWMRDAGCRVETYRPVNPFTIDRLNHRNHRRILVVDGRLGITGGSGMSGKWSGNGRIPDHWRDTDVLVEGPVVEQLQGAFADSWLEATGVVLGGSDYFPGPIRRKGNVDAQAVRSSPRGGSAAMYTMFLLAMASARHTIHIANPYFVPDNQMIETLIASSRRGVQVVLLLPGAIDHNLVREASQSELGRLLQAGVQVYQYQAALLHAKTMVVDGAWATIGSTNLDRRSFSLNDELNLVVYNPAVARRLEAVFEQDLTRSKPLTYEAWKDRGLFSRLLELLARPTREQL